MQKQLVVVVHGVGVREAGTSTELLSAALQQDDLPPHSSDDFRLQEPDQYDQRGLVRTFPAHQHRYRRYDDAGRVVKERVIADFYWGDIAAVRWGAVGAVLAFFRIAMGLGHAIRENARDVFPGAGGVNYVSRRLAGLASLIIHGPVVAINIVILLGMVVAAMLRPFAAITGGMLGEVLLTAILGAGLGFALVRWTHPYLSRFLGRWVVTASLMVVVLGFLHMALVTEQTPDPGEIVDRACAIFPEQPAPPEGATPEKKDDEGPRSPHQGCTDGFTGIYLIGLWLYVVMQVFIVFCLLFITLIAGHSGWRYWQDGPRRKAIRAGQDRLAPGERVRGINVTDLVTPALGLMLLLWFVLISAIFGVIGFVDINFLDALVPENEVIITALRGLLPALAGVLALGLIAGWIFARKYFAFRSKSDGSGFDPSDYLDRRAHYAETHRLLVAKLMLAVPMVFVVSLVGLYLHALGLLSFGWLNTALSDGTGAMLAGLALVSLALIVYLRDAFVAGLGIMTDVLAYLNDYSWAHDRLEEEGVADGEAIPRAFAVRREESDGLGFMDRLLVLFGLRLDPPRKGAPRGYWKRDRIQNRLRVFMKTFIDNEAPDELVIISHSQGTVIVLDVLKSDGADWRARVNHLSLITMGSPATHLYTHYFPSSFPCYAEDATLQPRSRGGAVLDSWTNIFRVDDFVGTHIATDPEAAWPREVPVPANGHTNYWIDRNVMAELQAVVQPTASRAKGS